MICSVRSLGLTGVSGYQVTAECFISNGLPAFEIVGLPDAAVKESRERVRAAAKSSKFVAPTVQLRCELFMHYCTVYLTGCCLRMDWILSCVKCKKSI